MMLILAFSAVSLFGHYVVDTVYASPEKAFSFSCTSGQFAPFSDIHLGFMLQLMTTVGLLLTLVHSWLRWQVLTARATAPCEVQFEEY